MEKKNLFFPESSLPEIGGCLEEVRLESGNIVKET